MANKKETPEEIRKRINEKFKKAPPGMGNVIGNYGKQTSNPVGKKTAKKKDA